MEKYFCSCCNEIKDYEVKNKAKKQYILYIDNKTKKYSLSKIFNEMFCDECMESENPRVFILLRDLDLSENLREIPENLMYLIKTFDVEGNLANEIIELLS